MTALAALPDLAAAFPEVLGGIVLGELKICKNASLFCKVLHRKLHLQITCAETELASKAVKGPALPLQGIHHIHGSDSFPLGMLGVGDRITDDILQEDLGIESQNCEISYKQLP